MSDTIIVAPPADGRSNSITVNGRTYTCAIGSTIDVPDFDAEVMGANGWLIIDTRAGGGSGSSGLGWAGYF